MWRRASRGLRRRAFFVAMVSARAVNLGHPACGRPGSVPIASTCRRPQRFFQHVSLAEDRSARLAVPLLGLTGAWRLRLDRTNWKIGTRDVSILMPAITTRRFRAPLMWTGLDKAGSGNAEERITLMRRHLALLGSGSAQLLLADREFIHCLQGMRACPGGSGMSHLSRGERHPVRNPREGEHDREH